MEIELGEVYHVNLNSWHWLEIKGRKVKMLHSQHAAEFERIGIYEIDLRLLAKEHIDCYMDKDVFFYGPEMKQYMLIWLDAGSAYRELGFYYFVTLMGEEPRRADE